MTVDKFTLSEVVEGKFLDEEAKKHLQANEVSWKIVVQYSQYDLVYKVETTYWGGQFDVVPAEATWAIDPHGFCHEVLKAAFSRFARSNDKLLFDFYWRNKPASS